MRLEELRTPNAFSWLPVLSLLLRGNYSRKLGRKISLKRWQPNSTYIIKRQPICSKFQTSSSFFQTKYDMGVKLGPRAKHNKYYDLGKIQERCHERYLCYHIQFPGFTLSKALQRHGITLSSYLIHFNPLAPFGSLWKHQKPEYDVTWSG